MGNIPYSSLDDMANLPYITRKLFWVGSSKDDLSAFPSEVKGTLGVALRMVQNGQTPDIAVPLTQFGSGVFELKDKHDGESYRAVYAVKLKRGVYVLDAFHKKSKSGKAIPKEIKQRIEARLKCAKDQDEETEHERDKKQR